MHIRSVLLLLALSFAALPVHASDGSNGCVQVSGDVACDDVAVSVFGSASGGFLAVSGRGDATTYMDRCLESVCPSLALALFGGDAYAECHASSVCVAVAGWGHAEQYGPGYAVGTCDVAYGLCYPPLLA